MKNDWLYPWFHFIIAPVMMLVWIIMLFWMVFG